MLKKLSFYKYIFQKTVKKVVFKKVHEHTTFRSSFRAVSFSKQIEEPHEKLTFLAHDGSQVEDRPKIAPRPLQDDLQECLFSSSFLSSILVRFCSHFGCHVGSLAGASWAPSPDLVELKTTKMNPCRPKRTHMHATRARMQMQRAPELVGRGFKAGLGLGRWRGRM